MKKNIIAILMASLMLMTILITFSIGAIEQVKVEDTLKEKIGTKHDKNPLTTTKSFICADIKLEGEAIRENPFGLYFTIKLEDGSRFGLIKIKDDDYSNDITVSPDSKITLSRPILPDVVLNPGDVIEGKKWFIGTYKHDGHTLTKMEGKILFGSYTINN